MKKYCKRIDITNREFISNAVRECLTDKIGRTDTLKLFHEYSGAPMELLHKIVKDRKYYMLNGIIETIIDSIRGEILNNNISFRPIYYVQKREGLKMRRIGIQDIKQQLYDYIAVNGLKEMLRKKIGYYQCAALPGKGQVMGARAIKRWLRNKAHRYAWKGDILHCFENISRERMIELLRRCVDNELLLKLVQILLNSFEKGLSIGSYLSQYLANFFLSYAYHYATEQLYKIRKCRDGNNKRVNLISKVLFYMDDLLLIGNCLKDLKMACKRLKEYLHSFLELEVKDNEQIIDLENGYIDMMGYKISRKNLTVRSRIFIKTRRNVKDLRKAIQDKYRGKIIKTFKSLSSRNGWLINSDGKKVMKKYKIVKLLKTAKELIKNEKDDIRHTATTCIGYGTA
jgi:hypothetical protein